MRTGETGETSDQEPGVEAILASFANPLKGAAKWKKLLKDIFGRSAGRWWGGGLLTVFALPHGVSQIYFYLQNATQIPGMPSVTALWQTAIFAFGTLWFSAIGHQLGNWFQKYMRQLGFAAITLACFFFIAYATYRALSTPNALRETAYYWTWPAAVWLSGSLLFGLLIPAGVNAWTRVRAMMNLDAYTRAATLYGLMITLIIVSIGGYDLSVYPKLSPPRRARLAYTDAVAKAKIPQDSRHSGFTVLVTVIGEDMGRYCISFYLDVTAEKELFVRWLSKKDVGEPNWEQPQQPGQVLPNPGSPAATGKTPSSASLRGNSKSLQWLSTGEEDSLWLVERDRSAQVRRPAHRHSL